MVTPPGRDFQSLFFKLPNLPTIRSVVGPRPLFNLPLVTCEAVEGTHMRKKSQIGSPSGHSVVSDLPAYLSRR
jgi:hypothetical protein